MKSSEAAPSDTGTLILAVLENGALHGYGVAREIERRSDALLSVGEGALYPALRALERDGFVVSEWQTQESGPARRVYSLTDGGKTELIRRGERWRRFAGAVNAILGGNPHEQLA